MWPPQDSSAPQGVRVAEGWHSAARAACREDRPGHARAGGTVPSVCLVPAPDERGSPSTRGDQPRRGQPSPGPRGHRGFPQKAPSGLERLERPHLLEDGVPAGAGRHGPPQRRGAVRPAYPRALLWSRGGGRFPCRPRGQQQLRARADAWAQPPPGTPGPAGPAGSACPSAAESAAPMSRSVSLARPRISPGGSRVTVVLSPGEQGGRLPRRHLGSCRPRKGEDGLGRGPLPGTAACGTGPFCRPPSPPSSQASAPRS